MENKITITINKEVSREILENIFVTALEGGSNYWYHLSEDAVKLIRSVVSKEKNPCLSTAILEAILDHNVEIPINDAEDEEEILGVLSKKIIQERLQNLANSSDYWALERELAEDGMDAESSDVVFQHLVMGEIVFG